MSDLLACPSSLTTSFYQISYYLLPLCSSLDVLTTNSTSRLLLSVFFVTVHKLPSTVSPCQPPQSFCLKLNTGITLTLLEQNRWVLIKQKRVLREGESFVGAALWLCYNGLSCSCGPFVMLVFPCSINLYLVPWTLQRDGRSAGIPLPANRWSRAPFV